MRVIGLFDNLVFIKTLFSHLRILPYKIFDIIFDLSGFDSSEDMFIWFEKHFYIGDSQKENSYKKIQTIPNGLGWKVFFRV